MMSLSTPYRFLQYTKILEVNLFAFAYRLFHRDFSPIKGTLHEADLNNILLEQQNCHRHCTIKKNSSIVFNLHLVSNDDFYSPLSVWKYVT